MSKRLQILLPEADYRAIVKVCRHDKKKVSEWVRESLRRSLKYKEAPSAEDRIASVLRFASYSGPTGDIEEILSEIERGREFE